MIINQITIPTPFLVGPVNIWLIKDGKNILIDCGPKTPEARIALEEALSKHNLTFSDIDEIWLTHAHPDHFGLAGEIQKLRNIPVKLHPAERDNLDSTSNSDLFRQLFLEGGVPEEHIQTMKQQRLWYIPFFTVPEITWIEASSELSSGKNVFKTIATPGHSPGHLSFLHEESNSLIGGDVLIEHVSSNALISFDEDGNRRNSLAELRESLEMLSDFGGVVYPGHGEVILNPSKTAQNHLDAQDKRYHAILTSIGRNPKTWFEITQSIFPKSNKQDYIFLTLSEVLGYLDRGVLEDKLKRSLKEDGKAYYQLA